MTVETLLVMVFGAAALIALRLVLAFVGKDFERDHPHVPLPRRTLGDMPTTVCRGTGRSRHLIFFPTEEETHAAAVGNQAPRRSVEPVRIAS